MLQAKVIEDWKLALKNKDKKKDTLSMIITELKNKAIKENVMGEQGRLVSDELAIEVLQKMAKQRRESIIAYQDANRADLASKESEELSVIQSYLPKEISDEELTDMIKKIIINVNATSKKDIGKVMPEVIRIAQGRADGRKIQAIVQGLLA